MRIMASRSSENVIDGLVITFTDISAVKRTNEEFNRFQSVRAEFTENLVKVVRGPVVMMDEDLRVLAANKSFYTTFEIPEEEAKGQRLYELKGGQWNIPALRALLEEVWRSGKEVVDHSLEHVSPSGRKKTLLNARRLQREGMDTPMILLALEEVTEG
jgi:two-component system CheB/CheR fusion protein